MLSVLVATAAAAVNQLTAVKLLMCVTAAVTAGFFWVSPSSRGLWEHRVGKQVIKMSVASSVAPLGPNPNL